MLALSRELLDALPKNGPTDPIEYYRKPFVGELYRRRINLGLGLLGDRRFTRALEVGYGAGAVLAALSPGVGELHGIDLDAEPEPVVKLLGSRGVKPELRKASVYELPYPDSHFELVVSFSVFEHLHEYPRALREVHRVLAPNGLFLLGMPAVNRMMEVAFRAIGFKGIDDHHVTTPAEVAAAFAGAGFREQGSAFLDFPAARPAGLRLYYDWLLEKSSG
jgi:SAM-dependent methyltransferase